MSDITAAQQAQASSESQTQSSSRALRLSDYLPLAFAAGIVVLSFMPRAQVSPTLTWSLWGAAGGLLLFWIVAMLRVRQGSIEGGVRLVVRKPHWVQGLLQASIYVYWGYHWDRVYDQLPLVLAQIFFLYALEGILSWQRGKQWYLGFGPVPITLSINLFLWFRDEFFYLQFLTVLVGVLGKEFVTWQKNGRTAHIFNPSAFALSIASVFLIAMSGSGITWGHEISNTLEFPQYIYIWIFALGLVVQYLFGVTLVTLAAAMTLIIVGMIYTAATGVYFFYTSDIPIAVFLGLHLLVTDPATSPRSKTGKAMFGALYALSVMALFFVLDAAGTPTFYDKLLAIPLLNISIQMLDRLGERMNLARLVPAGWSGAFEGRRTNFLHMAIWILLCGALFLTGRLGTDHEGRNSAFWEQACVEERFRACHTLHRLMNNACSEGEAFACAKTAWMAREGVGTPQDSQRAFTLMQHACDNLAFAPACASLNEYRPSGN